MGMVRQRWPEWNQLLAILRRLGSLGVAPAPRQYGKIVTSPRSCPGSESNDGTKRDPQIGVRAAIKVDRVT
jgi:hypothetical protein